MKRRAYIPFHKRMSAGVIYVMKLSIIASLFIASLVQNSEGLCKKRLSLITSPILKITHDLICLHVGKNACRRAQMRHSLI